MMKNDKKVNLGKSSLFLPLLLIVRINLKRPKRSRRQADRRRPTGPSHIKTNIPKSVRILYYCSGGGDLMI